MVFIEEWGAFLLEMSASKFKSCFICGRFGYGKENSTVFIFKVTEKNLEEWQKMILKKWLKVGSLLCERHFDDQDIIKGKIILDGFYPFTQRRQSETAVPKHLLGNGIYCNQLKYQNNNIICAGGIGNTKSRQAPLKDKNEALSLGNIKI